MYTIEQQLSLKSDQVKTLSQANHFLEQKAEKMQQRIKELEVLHHENGALRAKIRELHFVEQKYKAYKQREPEIKHYLNAFTVMTR